MKLSISNIAWTTENDAQIYALMEKYGYTGLEIAPTRIFTDAPYDKINEAAAWAEKLKKEYSLCVSSMQSIWYGRQERIFGTSDEREFLVYYTKKAIDFAAAMNCKNLVFGCPRNRRILADENPELGIEFFKEVGDYAAEKGTVIGLEANPPIYNTNYINDTASAFQMIEQVNSDGFKLNLDIGTMVFNDEKITDLKQKVNLINHVHISEPGLEQIERRKIHKELKEILSSESYQGYVSIEMKNLEDINILEKKMKYVRSIFG